jgi:hypothetical protein
VYSEKITQKQLELTERQCKVKLQRYDVAKVEAWSEHLQSLVEEVDEKSGEVKKFKRNLREEEKKFIENEVRVCKVDFEYWANRYATIIKDGVEGGGKGKLFLWESQRKLIESLGKLEEENWDRVKHGETVDGIRVALNKARQLGACLVAGTRVLMADLRWTPIENVKPGDEVIAFDEHNSHRKGQARKLHKAKVVGTCSMRVPTHRIYLSDGTILQGTPHHKFLCTQRGRDKYEWRELQDMKSGDKVRRILYPWNDSNTYEDGWFGGMLDGEGFVSKITSRSGSEIGVCQVPGDVLDRAIAYLNDNKYSFRVEIDDRIGGASSKLGNKPVHKLVTSRLDQIFRLIGTTRPSRFISREFYEGKEFPQLKENALATVVKVEEAGCETVYDIETTTHTYIAEGFASHNTMISRCLLMHRLTLWPDHRGMSASVDDDKVDELYDRDVRILDNLPFYMHPAIGYNVKSEHLYFDKIDCRMLYQQSQQKTGLGQGRQFEVGHITECASFPYPLMIEHDFFPTLPQSLYTLCILESTPQGVVGTGEWWHDFTEDCRAGTRVDWTYIFIPWYVEAKKYRRTPPEGWNPSELTLKHAQKVHETSPAIVGKAVMLTKEQLYWYETKRYEYQKGGNLASFLTNYCATHEESFQHFERSAIPIEILEELRLDTKPPITYELEVLQ